MRNIFGWDLPPGVSQRDIEEHFGDDEMKYNTFYVDIPSPECVTDQDGPMINIDSFETQQEALDFASKHFGADATGRVRLISGADFSKQDALEKAAPAMVEALEYVNERLIDAVDNGVLDKSPFYKSWVKVQAALALARGDK